MALSTTWATLPSAAATQTWRCGNTYTDQPCKGGRSIDNDDARAPEQKREADATAREARALADRMERDRLRQEAAASRTARAVLIEDKSPKPATPKLAIETHKKKKDRQHPDYFSARDPDAMAKQKTAKSSGKRAKKA
jgi:hypothetical protein